MGQSVTHATIQPTQSPSWEELLLIEVGEEESKDEGKTSNCSVCCFSMNLFILKKVQKNWQAATTVTLRLLVCHLEMVSNFSISCFGLCNLLAFLLMFQHKGMGSHVCSRSSLFLHLVLLLNCDFSG